MPLSWVPGRSLGSPEEGASCLCVLGRGVTGPASPSTRLLALWQLSGWGPWGQSQAGLGAFSGLGLPRGEGWEHGPTLGARASVRRAGTVGLRRPPVCPRAQEQEAADLSFLTPDHVTQASDGVPLSLLCCTPSDGMSSVPGHDTQLSQRIFRRNCQARERSVVAWFRDASQPSMRRAPLPAVPAQPVAVAGACVAL